MSGSGKHLKKKIKWKTLEDSFLNFELINVENNLVEEAKVSKLTKMDDVIKSKPPMKLDLFSHYKQWEQDSPVLTANRLFVIAGDNQNYVCTLCDISINAKRLSKLKKELLAHLNGKSHQKRVTSLIKNNNNEYPLLNSIIDSSTGNTNNSPVGTNVEVVKKTAPKVAKANKSKTTEIINNNKYPIKEDKKNYKEVNETIIIDFDSIYDSFNQLDPVVQTSKTYFRKKEGSDNYECTLCDQMIVNPLNVKGFKYILWVHMNKDSHREKLPNFLEIKNEFFTFIQSVLQKISIDFVDDFKYFTFGPVFNFVQCTLCEVAISRNEEGLEKHVKREGHRMMKKAIKKNKTSDDGPSLYSRTHIALKKLSAQVDQQFRADLQYIRKGEMPGYVVCVVCVEVIIATKDFLQKHINSGTHIINTLTDFVDTPREKTPIELLEKKCKKVINIDEMELLDKKMKAKKLKVAVKKWLLDDDYKDDDCEVDHCEDG